MKRDKQRFGHQQVLAAAIKNRSEERLMEPPGNHKRDYR